MSFKCFSLFHLSGHAQYPVRIFTPLSAISLLIGYLHAFYLRCCMLLSFIHVMYVIVSPSNIHICFMCSSLQLNQIDSYTNSNKEQEASLAALVILIIMASNPTDSACYVAFRWKTLHAPAVFSAYGPRQIASITSECTVISFCQMQAKCAKSRGSFGEGSARLARA